MYNSNRSIVLVVKNGHGMILILKHKSTKLAY